MKAYALEHDFSGKQKDELLQDLAKAAGVDWQALCSKRVLHLMTPEEAADAASSGVDLQLHTHRHRVYDERARFQREIDDNRRHIESITPGSREHFCYPGGFHLPEFPAWLKERGVRSATTCQPGIATASDSEFLLPRLLDTCTLSEAEFRSWVTGVAAFLPQRWYPTGDGQLIHVSGATANA
jgi:peptidoglycan/xylan/chitin deacetylase (PgdA/CDA1 family)